MKIAVEGCAHGELEKIYDLIASIQEQQNTTIDLLICCGDFQSTRNLQDLQCMAVPQKHLDMCSFYKYYSGEKKAPILTLFIGGNHEASNYLQELPYGGWVAPNIYYLGYAGVVDCNGIRIGGISGIFKGHDFLKGRFEFPPYDEATKRSVYHQRQIDVFRLKQLSTPGVDIMLSHDWPRGITQFGNVTQLLRFKPAFREDIECNKLGSAPCEDLLQKLRPPYWFAAHLHCKFAALVPHRDEEPTKFLALDKCLPKRRFLQVLDIPTSPDATNGPVRLKYDLEWLTILNLTNHLISIRSSNGYMPGEGSDERFNFTPTEEEKAKVLDRFGGDLHIPTNFVRIAEPFQPVQDDNTVDMRSIEQPQAYLNPQTTTFCDKLNIDDPLRLAMLMTRHQLNNSTYVDPLPVASEESEPETSSIVKQKVQNTDELTLDEEDDIEAMECAPQKDSQDQRPTTDIRQSLSSSLPQPKWRHHDSHDSDQSTTMNDSTSISTPNCSMLSLSMPQEADEKGLLSLSESGLAVDDLNLSSPHNSGLTTRADVAASEEQNKTESDNPPVKKFKRRNQTIYGKEDSE
ncbi:lariat debranching enzyme [Anopheles ziemanni]|uniref:lariat debranching enzyme n=1 Tax=Anopheles coustani TaxID=139045 RepID=UPI002657C630|nr:lariat debranching enzyme [Anopheles coustani]XP_058171967.1 lariat debranching enzyme [Anopheles ziemanni]